MLLFAALMIVFVVVTVNHFGDKQYVTDNVQGLPPVYVITAVLVPFCAAFVAGFWMLFLDSFKREMATGHQLSQPGVPPSFIQPEKPSWRSRVATFIRERGMPD
jgi:hypothetical protein